MDANLDSVFQHAVDSKAVPGVAAVALDRDGTVLYEKGFGHTRAGEPDSPRVTTKSPVMIWSCTKLLTSIAALQLIEQGKLKLKDKVETYLPEIAKLQLLKGFDADGKPILEDCKHPILVHHLLTHTSGLTYDFFNPDLVKYRLAVGQPLLAHVTRSAKEDYWIPLLFEPGARYEYGVNSDFLGWVVEKISGLGLAEYFEKNITGPLGLKKIRKEVAAEDEADFMTEHAKDANGELTATPMRCTPTEVMEAGGHFLNGSCHDYAQLLLPLINNGAHPTSGVRILKEETVRNLLFQDQLPTLGADASLVGQCPSALPPAVCPAEFLPGVKKGWSCGLLINHDAAPNGRSAGSGSWAGLGNCYYWADPVAGKVGFVVAAILPFMDRQVLHLADALERAVYGKPAAKEVGEAGSNFSGGFYKVD